MALLSRARGLAAAINAGKCCPSCLSSLAVKLKADEQQLDIVRRECHELWDACIRALTLPAHGDPKHQSAQFLRSLLSAASNCTLHASEVLFQEYLILMFVDAACSCLRACLSVGERSAVSRAQKKHKAFSNKRGAWPMCQEDLFPSGTDENGMLVDVVKIMRWSVDGKTPDPTLLLADLLYIAHPLVFPVLMANRKDLVLAVSRWICNPDSHEMVFGDEELTAHGLQFNEANTEAAVTLIRCLRDAPDADPDALLQFTLEHESFLFDSAQMGLKLLDEIHGPDSPLAGEIAAFAAVLHTRLAQPDSALSPDVLARVPAISQLDIAGVLHVLLTKLASRRRICNGPTCGVSVHASTDPDKTFKACKECRLVYYCSRACQRADWKDGRGIPHKVACRVLRKLATLADFRQPLAEFQRAMAPHTQHPGEQYDWSFFAGSFGLVLSMELFVRARQIHRAAANAIGRPDRFAVPSGGRSSGMDIVENIVRRQERFATDTGGK